MCGGALVVMLGMCAVAIDLGQMYNRKAELHGMAKAVALAAAGQLDGTAAGVTNAMAKAAAIANTYRHTYGRSYTWSNSAIRFSKSPALASDWTSAEGAKAQPAGVYYVEVDTTRLEDGSGSGTTFMAGVISPALASFTIADRAIAGRANLKLTPLAICAMSPAAGALRTNPGPPAVAELVEFGFRRGVSYDLMALNPNGTAGETFVVDPFTLPGKPYSSANTTVSKVGPSVCAGKIWAPGVMGAPIHVSRPFPLASLFNHLNSRFDDYTTGNCNANGAPPDYNVKSFARATVAWMGHTGEQTAKPYTDAGRAETVADPLTAPSGTTADNYGVLWSYAKAARYDAYAPGAREPKEGYATFGTGDWASLYKPKPGVSSYPGGSATPYQATGGSNYSAPSSAHLAISQTGRRVLNIPLLACPVPAGTDVTATVLGIGRFFMTVPATNTKISAEFAGVVPESALVGKVELFL
ncbi:pilus assembly protein TadE [Massilia sp. Dwa41.01b]|uniref:pilus assembly protein TadE n=1 Tax=unclassified Massilia TaxID=2609279 RepID=UPI001603AC3B|nr:MULTISPECIES: pilus assembly protein TadE [unclassified Massilia]QNA88972.1 pilus assembly protein TadE [Massilia sp. Dwa41.01b]QNA99863.1 pilus assembly protein TadE [Massilia sp. Se16.2.3]